MKLVRAFARQPRPWILAEMIVTLVAIGALDSITGYEVRLLPFYAGPIFVVAWFCEKKWAIVVGIIAGSISLSADWITHDPDLMSWTRPWEITRHMATTLVVALVGSALRAKTVAAVARIELLERSQRLEREIIKIRDAEQHRIGQDLHDGLCQYLAALTCSATALSEDLKKLKLRSEAAEATQLASLLENAVVQARDLAHELVPAHLAQFGLVLGLESLTESVSRLQRIDCTFESRGATIKYHDDEAKHFYRITQEAINNAVRHGKAQKILVSLHNDSESTTLQILDNGVGFSEDKANGAGMGLSLMRYRAHQLGCELDIIHPLNGGTLVSCKAKPSRKNGHEVANS